ncbi:MAG TPA: hypothetical protein VGW78_02155 [Candidatus Babeliales bacterium]|jgi:hypothetical protein|nr:hypothetical protein [Candidatus Babeliales bacterium]
MEKYINNYSIAYLACTLIAPIYAMQSIKPIWDVGNIDCHCTLYKRADGTFYIKIQSLHKPLFIKQEGQGVYNQISKLFFQDNFIFTFDSQLIDKYDLAINNTIPKTSENTQLPSKIIDPLITKIQNDIKRFQTSIHDKITSLISFGKRIEKSITIEENAIERFKKLLGEFMIAIFNKDKSSEETLVTYNEIEKNINNWHNVFINNIIEGLQASLPGTYKNIIAANDSSINNFFMALFFGSLNYTTNLAQDNAISKPFRIIYSEIQKLGTALHVDVAPIEPLATTAKKVLYNKWTMLRLLGIGALGYTATKLWPSKIFGGNK